MMHRFILCIFDFKVKVDHRDHNGLNNQRCNLRQATNQQNSRHQRKTIRNTSGFKGVSWVKYKCKWSARIWTSDKRVFLGYFNDKVAAAKAYDRAAKKYHGKFALTNF